MRDRYRDSSITVVKCLWQVNHHYARTGLSECGAETSVLGVFTDEAKANAACDRVVGGDRDYFNGYQHSIEVFEVDELNKVMDGAL